MFRDTIKYCEKILKTITYPRAVTECSDHEDLLTVFNCIPEDG
jgi:hypothetical protein